MNNEQKYEPVEIKGVGDFQVGDIIAGKGSTHIGNINVIVSRPIPTKEVVQEVEVDPGEGFRLLGADEIIQEGDAHWFDTRNDWDPTMYSKSDGIKVSSQECAYRRPIRLQDKEHRYLDVGEPILVTDEWKTPTGWDCVKELMDGYEENSNPEFYRRALERGVSKSWAEQHRDELVAGQWYEVPGIISAHKFIRVVQLRPRALNAVFEDHEGVEFGLSATEQHPFIPCNPPSPQRSEDTLEGLRRLAKALHIKNYRSSETAPPSLVEDSEEVFPIGTMSVGDLRLRDMVGAYEILNPGVNECRVCFDGDKEMWLPSARVQGWLDFAPVRRPKPEPPKTPFWEGPQPFAVWIDREVVTVRDLKGELIKAFDIEGSLTENCENAAKFVHSLLVKVTVEAI